MQNKQLNKPYQIIIWYGLLGYFLTARQREEYFTVGNCNKSNKNAMNMLFRLLSKNMTYFHLFKHVYFNIFTRINSQMGKKSRKRIAGGLNLFI